MTSLSNQSELLSIREASKWATSFLNKSVSEANISYLIQYGRVRKISGNGTVQIIKNDLIKYYNNSALKSKSWQSDCNNSLNWELSFEQFKESETTKHVHRIHPYKGKFIPQLVEYFLDSHTDNLKKQTFFNVGDIILDPFCGSGTTLVQANELNMHAIGIDISAFNSLIANTKIGTHSFKSIEITLNNITNKFNNFLQNSPVLKFETELKEKLQKFNNKYFPSPDFKYKVRQNQIDESKYGQEKDHDFLIIYTNLLKKYGIQLQQSQNKSFLDKWYLKAIREEIDFMFEQIKQITDLRIKKVISIILSRTIRSCRATTHSDLATLKEPQTTTYYCKKHGKVCKPLFSILNWWKRYSIDTIKRLKQFESLKTDTKQICLTSDSQIVDIFAELEKKNKNFAKLVKNQKIKGIFSSPPYVGAIDYHEQHSYAYDLFGFERKDKLEIGPLCKGQGLKARKSYIEGISAVLKNCRKYLKNDFSIFLVANDKWGIYPEIANKSDLKIIEQFKRPVLNRTEKNKGAYTEIIFHLKVNDNELNYLPLQLLFTKKQQ